MYSAQIINNTSNGAPEFAVLPYNEFVALLRMKAKEEGFDSVEDFLDYHDAVEVLQTDTERIPYEEVLRQRAEDEEKGV